MRAEQPPGTLPPKENIMASTATATVTATITEHCAHCLGEGYETAEQVCFSCDGTGLNS
jgi:DnaJ-class molecular chaperone